MNDLRHLYDSPSPHRKLALEFIQHYQQAKLNNREVLIEILLRQLSKADPAVLQELLDITITRIYPISNLTIEDENGNSLLPKLTGKTLT